MLVDQLTFLIIAGLCLMSGLVLSYMSPEREIIERKIPDEDVGPYPPKKIDVRGLIGRK